MDQTDWKLLKILQQEKSMVKAAERLFISQPAISYRLTRMENEFGQSLFVRSNRGVEMTSAGQRLYSFANLMIQYDDEIHHAVCHMGSALSGSIRLGTTEPMFEYFLASQLKDFNTKYPNIKVFVHIAHTPELQRLVQTGELLMCTIRGKRPEGGHTIQIFEEPLVIISPEPITEEMMMTRPLLRNLPGTTAIQLIDEWVNSHFPTPPPASPISVAGTSRDAVKLVKVGLGWSVIPASRFHEATDHLYWKPIYHSDGTPYRYQTYLHYTDEASHFDTYMAYAGHLQEFFSHLELPQTADMP